MRDLVANGEVSVVVLAQDRDRLVREPAYHYLLKREFEEHGCTLRALNDWGDDSPEGQLAEGVLDQIAKYERVKMAERSRRGKLRKTRGGKMIAGRMAPTTTVALGDHDPLQACVAASMAEAVHDRWLGRRLPALVRGCGFEPARFRGHGFVETTEGGTC